MLRFVVYKLLRNIFFKKKYKNTAIPKKKHIFACYIFTAKSKI